MALLVLDGGEALPWATGGWKIFEVSHPAAARTSAAETQTSGVVFSQKEA